MEFCHLANGTDGCVYGINRESLGRIGLFLFCFFFGHSNLMPKDPFGFRPTGMQRNCNYRHDCLPLCDHVYYDAVVTRLAGPRATKSVAFHSFVHSSMATSTTTSRRKLQRPFGFSFGTLESRHEFPFLSSLSVSFFFFGGRL